MWDGVERRRGPDWIDVSVNVLNIAVWFIFLAALVIFHYARPEFEYVYYQLMTEKVTVRNYWQQDLRDWMLNTLYVCVTLTLMTLVVNNFRLKRKSDRQRYSLYMLVVVCIVFIGVVIV